MIWSIDELVKIILCGEKVVIDNVTNELSNPQNEELFRDENFSLLWGILGVAGIKGVNHTVLPKIWDSMKRNQALDAFDKELLADYTEYLGKNLLDKRLIAWKGLDNLQADMKFKKTILMPLVKINKNYAYEVNMQAFNPIRIIGLLDRIELNDDIKEMLLHVRGQGAACGISGEEIINHYEKKKILVKICEFLSYTTRNIKQHEKEFLFNYLRDAVIDGFEPNKIRLNDDVLHKLVAFDDKSKLSEIEITHLQHYNHDLAEFAMSIDTKDGFYEKVADKLMEFDTSLFQMLYERCMALMDSPHPKGIIFALELINKNKIKSAVKILIELAKRGKATEMATFMHRLLPFINGSETMIVSILRLNLKQLKKNKNYDENSVLNEYTARVYLIAIRSFIDAKLYRKAALLLKELIKEGWINSPKLEDESGILINEIILVESGLAGILLPLSSKLNLKAHKCGGKVLLGRNKEDILSNVRSRINIIEEDAIKYPVAEEKKEVSNSIKIENIKNIETIDKTIPISNNEEKVLEEKVLIETDNIVENTNNTEKTTAKDEEKIDNIDNDNKENKDNLTKTTDIQDNDNNLEELSNSADLENKTENNTPILENIPSQIIENWE